MITKPKADKTEADVVVFLKTSEEAQCPGETCKWKYTSTLPKITAFTSEFDADSASWRVKVVGTGMRDKADSGPVSDLQINKVSQKMVSHTDTMAVFEITKVEDLESKDVNLFFPVGIPDGHDLVRAGVKVEPKLMMITPNDATPGSVLMTAIVPGLGSKIPTKDLELVDGTGRAVCRTDVKFVEYGKISCWTRREDYKDYTDIKLKHGDKTIECSNTDKKKCQFKAFNEGKIWPKVDSVKVVGNTIEFTGDNFYTAGYTPSATYNFIAASSVNVESKTKAVATFVGGVPFLVKEDQSRDERANLDFKLDGSDTIFRAINSGEAVRDVKNEFSLTSSDAVSCSFNGGCTLGMKGTAGLKTMLTSKPKENFITVCEQKCEILEAESGPGDIKCKIPAVPTTYSNNNFQIGKV